MRSPAAAYAVRMSIFDSEEIYEQVLSGAVQASLDLAAEADGMSERDAIGSMRETIAAWNIPAPVLALAVASLAVRFHRTRQTEAIVNIPAPGQSPA